MRRVRGGVGRRGGDQALGLAQSNTVPKALHSIEVAQHAVKKRPACAGRFFK